MEEENDIDVKRDDTNKKDDRSCSQLINGSNEKLGLLRPLVGEAVKLQSSLSQSTAVQSSKSESNSIVTFATTVSPLSSLATSNPFAAAAAAAAAAVSGFTPATNLLTPFMKNAALGKFFGKS